MYVYSLTFTLSRRRLALWGALGPEASLQTMVPADPSGRTTATSCLFAARVTMPKTPQACLAASSAASTKATTRGQEARTRAALFASMSTNLLALQSSAVKRLPSGKTMPMLTTDKCAGIQRRQCGWTSRCVWPSRAMPSLRQILARGLELVVAQASPTMAVLTRLWQSVRIRWRNGVSETTNASAHASAAAAEGTVQPILTTK